MAWRLPRRRFLGPPEYESEVAQRTSVPGVATGLAYTAYGGEIIFVEATAYSGKGQLQVTPVDLNALIKEMGDLLGVSKSKKAAIEYELAEDLPSVDADAAQIGQILMNLITNASEALGEESGVIAIRTGTVMCDTNFLRDTYLSPSLPAGEYVYLEVRDTGVGMAAETLDKLFDPFFSTKFVGRGLGLAAVLGIIRATTVPSRWRAPRAWGRRFASSCRSAVWKRWKSRNRWIPAPPPSRAAPSWWWTTRTSCCR